MPPDSSPCGPTRGSTPSSMFATSSPSTSDGTNNGPDGCVDLADFAIGVRRPDMGAHPTTRSRWFRSFRWSTASDRSQYERGRGQPGSLGLSTVRASGGGSPIVPMGGGSIAGARGHVRLPPDRCRLGDPLRHRSNHSGTCPLDLLGSASCHHIQREGQDPQH